MNRILRSLAGLVLLAAPLGAQDPVIAARMSGVGGSPEAKACKLSPGHFQVSSAAVYLQKALEASPANRDRLVHNAQQAALVAMTQYAQASNPAAWYYLGRSDGLMGDFPGADSSFAKMLALRPDCAAELENTRIALWYPVVAAAMTFQNAGQADSALYLYRAAYRFYAGKPGALTNMGRIFKEAGQTDSATFYLEKALALAATDTSKNGRDIALATAASLGTMYYNAGKYPDAVRTFRIAAQLDPSDADGQKNLGIAFRAAGMPDSAKAIDDRILAAAQASGSVTPDQQFDVGVAQFNAKKYADAAVSFRNVIAADPNRHDAIENLANSYFALDSTSALIATASQLLALEPMNYDMLRLLASGYRKAKQQQKTIDTFNRVLGITTSLDATGFSVAADKATLMLHAQGRAGTDPNGKTLSPAGYQIVVEFLDATGKVVGTQTAAIPALATDTTQDVTVTGTGTGIAGWRYHKA